MYSLFLISILFTVVSGITKGKVADNLSFPYQVSLAFDGYHICGGGIISPNYILTAAHCLTDDDSKRYQVRVGSLSLNKGGIIYAVKYFMKNNLYEVLLDQKKLFDIAVILVKEMTFIKYVVEPIALPLEKDITPYTSVGVVAGWGAVEFKGKPSDVLRFTDAQIWRQVDCMAIFGPRKIKDEVFCAGHQGKDSCSGDSGGPYVYNKKMIGIVSYGRGCGDPHIPGVYTNVITNLPWIQKTIKYLDTVKKLYVK